MNPVATKTRTSLPAPDKQTTNIRADGLRPGDLYPQWSCITQGMRACEVEKVEIKSGLVLHTTKGPKVCPDRVVITFKQGWGVNKDPGEMVDVWLARR